MPPSPLTQPHPAEPILGSSLLSDELLDDIIAQSLNPRTTPKKDATSSSRISTGVNSVDRALGGGLEKGCVVAVSGGLGGGGGSEVGVVIFFIASMKAIYLDT